MAEGGFKGMAELIRGLQRMGERVRAEAGDVVRTAAQTTAQDVRQRYPRHTGTLQDRVVLEMDGGPGSLRWKVRSKAPHAWIFDHGTVQRFLASNGANRGRMPAQSPQIFIPSAIRNRAVMVSRLVQLMKRQTVPGMTGQMDVRVTGGSGGGGLL